MLQQPFRIVITKDGESVRADCINLPGTPPIGRGRNPYEAIGSLMKAITIDPTWVRLGFPDFQFLSERETATVQTRQSTATEST